MSIKPRHLLAAAACAALTGCGGSTTPHTTPTAVITTTTPSTSTAFRQAYLALRPELNGIGDGIRRAVPGGALPAGAAQLPGHLLGLASRAAAALKKLVLLAPPAEVALPFGRLVGGLGRLEGDLRALAAALSGHMTALADRDARSLADELRTLREPAAVLRARLGILAGA